MNYLRFVQPRSIVFERQFSLDIVDVEPPESIGVGEIAEVAQLLFGERGLQFVGDLYERHGEALYQWLASLRARAIAGRLTEIGYRGIYWAGGYNARKIEGGNRE